MAKTKTYSKRFAKTRLWACKLDCKEKKGNALTCRRRCEKTWRKYITPTASRACVERAIKKCQRERATKK